MATNDWEFFKWLDLSPDLIQSRAGRQQILELHQEWQRWWETRRNPTEKVPDSLETRKQQLHKEYNMITQLNQLHDTVKDVVSVGVRDPRTNSLVPVMKDVYKTADQVKREQRGQSKSGELPILAYHTERGTVKYLTTAQREACMRGTLPYARNCPNPPPFNEVSTTSSASPGSTSRPAQ